MKLQVMRKPFGLLALAFFLSSHVFADPSGPTRATTPAERQFHQQMNANFQKVMPPIPQDWKLLSDNVTDPPGLVAAGSEKQPYQMNFFWAIERKDREQKTEAATATGAARLSRIETNEDGLSKSSEATLKKLEVLAGKMDAAMERGDTTAVQKYQAEINTLNSAAMKMMDDEKAKAGYSDEALQKMVADLGATVHININEPAFRMAPSAKPIAAPDGASLAYFEPNSPGTNPAEAITYLFVGPWLKTADPQELAGGLNSAKQHTSVQNLVIKIQAEKSRAQSLVKGLALKKIAGWCL